MVKILKVWEPQYDHAICNLCYNEVCYKGTALYCNQIYEVHLLARRSTHFFLSCECDSLKCYFMNYDMDLWLPEKQCKS